MVTIAYPPGRWDSEESQRVCSVKTAAGKTAQVHNRVLIWLKKKAERKQGRPLGEGKTDLPVGSLLTINLDSREGQSPTWMELSSSTGAQQVVASEHLINSLPPTGA